MTNIRNHPSVSPRLTPTGNVDEVLLTGKRSGKDLSMFQSVGLAIIGLGVALGIGAPTIVFESVLQARLARLGIPYAKDLSAIVLGSLMCLVGVIWITVGLSGVGKILRQRRSVSKTVAKRHRGG